ncbi:MAG: lipopolysaccharide heptosyltransferase I [bacterium]|nr:lipopolysaccharide heptosyltransferase I [bacterium]
MRILFVKLGAIGDIVHALPALAEARRAFPDAVIDWVVESRSAEILRDNPAIDRLLEIDTHSIRGLRSPDSLMREIRRQAGPLRSAEYDLAIDLQGLLKSALVAKVSGAPHRWGFNRANLKEPAARLMYTDRMKVSSGINVIEKNLRLVRGALEITDISDEIRFPIGIGIEHRAEAEGISSRAGRGFVILNPAGGWTTKLWPAENYGRLAEKIWSELGLASIVTTGPKEELLAARVIESSGDAEIIVAEPSLKGFYELAKMAVVYVGGDTGPTHLAVAAGAPVVGIFGPTEWWRNGSPRPYDIGVGREDIPCRVDCHRRTCSNWICMEISVDTVFEAVARRVEKARQGRKEAAI